MESLHSCKVFGLKQKTTLSVTRILQQNNFFGTVWVDSDFDSFGVVSEGTTFGTFLNLSFLPQRENLYVSVLYCQFGLCPPTIVSLLC